MILLAVTTDTWIVTGLGFGIVLGLLFCLVYILLLFGWVMQKTTAPKTPKPEVKPVAKEEPAQSGQAQEESQDDTAAIAMALYLASADVHHDTPTPMISLKQRETAWTTKSIGLN